MQLKLICRQCQFCSLVSCVAFSILHLTQVQVFIQNCINLFSLKNYEPVLFEIHSTNAIPNAVNPCPFTHFSIHTLSCTFSPNSLKQSQPMMPFQTPSIHIHSDIVNSPSFKQCQLMFFPQNLKAILSGGHVTGLDILMFRFSEKRQEYKILRTNYISVI